MRFKDFFKPGQNIINVSDSFAMGHEWLTLYLNNADTIDRYFLFKYGNKIINIDYVGSSDEETTVILQENIKTYLLLNARRYDRLCLNYTVDYTPQANSATTQEPTDHIGHETHTNTLGATKNTDTFDNTKTTTDNGVTPFDSDINTPVSNITVSVNGSDGGKIVNTSETAERVNTDTIKGNNEDGSRDNKHNSHIYGNIGVTTTVQMLTADNAYWNVLDFYNNLFNDCINECTIGLWEV